MTHLPKDVTPPAPRCDQAKLPQDVTPPALRCDQAKLPQDVTLIDFVVKLKVFMDPMMDLMVLLVNLMIDLTVVQFLVDLTIFGHFDDFGALDRSVDFV